MCLIISDIFSFCVTCNFVNKTLISDRGTLKTLLIGIDLTTNRGVGKYGVFVLLQTEEKFNRCFEHLQGKVNQYFQTLWKIFLIWQIVTTSPQVV